MPLQWIKQWRCHRETERANSEHFFSKYTKAECNYDFFGTNVHWRVVLNQLEKKLAHLRVICSCFDSKHLGIWCFPWRCGDVIRWKFQLSLMLQRKAWKLNSNVLKESEQRGQIKRIQQLFIWRFTHLCDDVGKLSDDFWTYRPCQCYHLLESSWPSSARCVATVIEEYVEQELFILVFLWIIWIKKSLEKMASCARRRGELLCTHYSLWNIHLSLIES